MRILQIQRFILKTVHRQAAHHSRMERRMSPTFSVNVLHHEDDSQVIRLNSSHGTIFFFIFFWNHPSKTIYKPLSQHEWLLGHPKTCLPPLQGIQLFLISQLFLFCQVKNDWSEKLFFLKSKDDSGVSLHVLIWIDPNSCLSLVAAVC